MDCDEVLREEVCVVDSECVSVGRDPTGLLPEHVFCDANLSCKCTCSNSFCVFRKLKFFSQLHSVSLDTAERSLVYVCLESDNKNKGTY